MSGGPYVDLHALCRTADARIVAPRFLYYLIDTGIVMIGVMVEENQFFGSRFHDNVYRFTPVAVSPAALASLVFCGKILRVVNQQIGASGKLSNRLVELSVSG